MDNTPKKIPKNTVRDICMYVSATLLQMTRRATAINASRVSPKSIDEVYQEYIESLNKLDDK